MKPIYLAEIQRISAPPPLIGRGLDEAMGLFHWKKRIPLINPLITLLLLMALIFIRPSDTFCQLPVVNLIENGDFEAFDCEETLETSCDFYFHGFYGECVLPWGNAYGTSAIMDLESGTPDHCVVGGHGTEIGRYFAQVKSCWVEGTGVCEREAFFAQLNSPCALIPGQEYDLTFQARTNNIQFEISQNASHANDISDFWLYVASVQGLDNIQGGSSGSGGDLNCSNAQSGELGRQVIHSVQAFDTDDEWEVVSFSFTPPSGFVNDQIMFWGQYESEDEDHHFRNIFFDNFVLTCESLLEPDYDYSQTGPMSFDFSGDIVSAITGIEVTDWYWDFGDCQTSHQQNPSHTYTFAGTYDVCLMITDNRCCTHSVCFEVSTDPDEPVVTPIIHCLEVCLNTEFASGSYSWDFDDENTSMASSPCHTYEEEGVYDITVSIEGPCGQEYVDVIQVEVDDCGAYDPCEEYGGESNDYVVGSQTCDVTTASSISLPSFLYDKKLRINGTLVVNQDLTLSTCRVEMGPEAEILVNAGKSLRIVESVLYGCDTLWRSVRVKPGGYLQLFGDAPCHFQDARAAIFAHGDSRLNLFKANFDKNMIGLYIPPSIIQSGEPVPNTVKLDEFRELTFTCTDDLLPPSQAGCVSQDVAGGQNYFTIEPDETSFAGALIHDVTAIALAPVLPGMANQFIQLNNGIVSHRSNLIVRNACFKDMPVNNNYPPIRGYGIYADGNGHMLVQNGFGKDGMPSFRNIHTGIYTSKMNTDISANSMVDVNRGIEVANAKNRSVDIGDNRIEADFIGVFLNHNDPTYEMDVHDNHITLTDGPFNVQFNPFSMAGIFIRENSNVHENSAFIRNNTILTGEGLYGINGNSMSNVNLESNTISIGSDESAAGIAVFNSQKNIIRDNTITGDGITTQSYIGVLGHSGILMYSSPENYVLCNNLEELHNGLMMANMCNTSIVGRNVFGGQFKYGLHYNPLGESGPQYNTLNRWPGATVGTGDFEARHQGGLVQILNSKYYVHSNVTDGMPDPVDPEEEWFEQSDVFPPILECGNFEHPRDVAPPGETERLTAVDSLTNPEDAPAYTWNQRLHLMGYLRSIPDSIWADEIYEDFLAYHDTTAAGVWDQLERDIRASLAMDGTMITEHLVHVDTLLTSLYGLRHYQGVLDTTSSPTDSLAALLAMDTIWMELAPYMSSRQEATTEVDSLLELDWENLLAEVDLAPDEEDWTEALKEFWTVYLEYQITGTLTSPQITKLETLAENCELTHGRAVFQAGSLRESRPSMLYFYECPPPPEPLISSNELLDGESVKFRYFPNPVRDHLVIAWDAEQPGGALTLTHISGTQVKRLEVRGRSLTLDMNDIPSGMYLLTWTPLTGQPVSEMLVLQH